MSTWQIFPGAGNSFRWEISNRGLGEHESEPTNVFSSSSRLPSMADLLFQGCSKLLENSDQVQADTPMFKTGLGRPVAVKQSSIAKACSVLGEDAPPFDAGQVQASDSERGFANSFFQTGSGKLVKIPSDGLARAKTILGLHEFDDACNLQGFQDTRNLCNDDEQHKWQNLCRSDTTDGVNCDGNMQAASVSRSLYCETDIGQSGFGNQTNKNLMQSKMHSSAPNPPSIKFHTAGGRSLSISSDALQRARSLLGDPELGTFLNEEDANDSEFIFSNGRSNQSLPTTEENSYTCALHHDVAKNKFMSKSFLSPLLQSTDQTRSSVKPKSLVSGTNLIKQFDAVSYDNDCTLKSSITCLHKPLNNGLQIPTINTATDNSSTDGVGLRTCMQNPPNNGPQANNTETDNSSKNGVGLRTCLQKPPNNVIQTTNTVMDKSLTNDVVLWKKQVGRALGKQLADISNTIENASPNDRQPTNGKRIIGRTFASPFKRPRNSKFCTPMKSNINYVSTGLSNVSSEGTCSKKRVSARYPFQRTRINVKDYFGAPPLGGNLLASLPEKVRWIRSDNAEKFMFPDENGVSCIGPEDFCNMLVHSGASMHSAPKEWVINHYKWIIWKLASYERCYPTRSAGIFLTTSNVLEELKYRYEREVNHGHRSAIKRILEGDASPSSMLVLCISAIYTTCDKKNEDDDSLAFNEAQSHNAPKVELTDGWYSVDAVLDVLLLKQLACGKIFVGQKLRIWGARLSGWAGPVSPLEVPKTVNLLLHINGTYRAHWADRLGFCKGFGAPLAFKCIKSNGGPIPQTLVGIMRIYPLLYKERVSDGRSIVRSERMESKAVESYNQRRSVVIEAIVSEFQIGTRHLHTYNDSDSEEGAQISKILETASEPEILMAEMSPEQLSSFTTYQSRVEVIRQSDMKKAIEKALDDAGLSRRDVIPFMRVRVVGLTSKMYEGKDSPKEGLITIWNPTEKQKTELVEGKVYNVIGLVPTNSNVDTIYLQARDSTTWQPLSLQAIQHYKPFFRPRNSVLLSNLGQVPLSSEFDIAARVVFIGEVYRAASHRKQWVFVTDGSIELQSDLLLAICFCSPYVEDGLLTPINSNLSGSTVGFCNLIKRAKDQVNHIWIADATENSTYFLSFDASPCYHLKDAAAHAENWGKKSGLIIEKLREKVLSIVGTSEG